MRYQPTLEMIAEEVQGGPVDLMGLCLGHSYLKGPDHAAMHMPLALSTWWLGMHLPMEFLVEACYYLREGL